MIERSFIIIVIFIINSSCLQNYHNQNHQNYYHHSDHNNLIILTCTHRAKPPLSPNLGQLIHLCTWEFGLAKIESVHDYRNGHNLIKIRVKLMQVDDDNDFILRTYTWPSHEAVLQPTPPQVFQLPTFA